MEVVRWGSHGLAVDGLAVATELPQVVRVDGYGNEYGLDVASEGSNVKSLPSPYTANRRETNVRLSPPRNWGSARE